jgi:hypothetical protein
MSKQWKPGKHTVELNGPVRGSRIRRDPPPTPEKVVDPAKVQWSSDEREIWYAIIGILAFALAIDIIIVAISVYWT